MSSPRERLLAVTSDLVRRHGVAGTGLSTLLAESSTARASVYQHFPEGKDQLIEAATDIAAQAMRTGAWQSTSGAQPGDVVRQVVDRARETLVAEDFSRGCPVVAAAVAGPDHQRVVGAAGRAFTTWNVDLTEVLVAAGFPAGAAASFASVLVSAVEGAIVQSRALRSTTPLDDVATHLATLADVVRDAG